MSVADLIKRVSVFMLKAVVVSTLTSFLLVYVSGNSIYMMLGNVITLLALSNVAIMLIRAYVRGELR